MAKDFLTENDKTLTDFVYEGVWEKYGDNLLQKWRWTLSDVKALFLFGGFGLLLTLSQSRSWVLIRYIICLKNRTVRFDTNDPEPLQHLSQAKAILDVLPFFAYQFSRLKALSYRVVRFQRHHPNTEVKPDSSIISPWFGFFAALNLCVFVIMSVALPWQLSEGTLGKALVRSRMTNECQNPPNDLWGSALDQRIEVDAIFRFCKSKSKQACGNENYLQQPQITKRRGEFCMFPTNICHNDTKSFEITHWNITAREVGLNLKSKVMLNHRLTCTPIHLDPFLHFDKTRNNTSINLIDLRIKDKASESFLTSFDLPLNTMNGPNSLSAENSGYRMWKEHGPKDISILPKNQGNRFTELTRDELRREDGVSFLVIHRPGKTEYRLQVDDPFFAAHYKARKNLSGTKYLPDNEATALGCLEQFQYHTPTYNFHTPWGILSDQVFEIKKHFDQKKDDVAPEELLELGMFPYTLSIHRYLAERSMMFSDNLIETMPLTPEARSLQFGNPYTNRQSYTNQQWIAETEAWFFTALVEAILYMQNGVRFSFFVQKVSYESLKSSGFKGYSGDQTMFCDRVLFLDENYTNISWVGFWITIVLFTLVCIASFAIRWLDATTRRGIKGLVVVGEFLLENAIFAAGLVGWWLWFSFPSLKSVRGMGLHRSSPRGHAADVDDRRASGDLVHLESRLAA